MPMHADIRPDGVAVLTLDNPPVNSLSKSLVRSLKEHFSKLSENPMVKAFVITGTGDLFCAGAELTEFAETIAKGPEAFRRESPVQELCAVIDIIDASPKTVIAAINGAALGGGLELALACHYRVAQRSATVGFPEVQLGILPGCEGTQRIIRVAPLELVLPMLLSGVPVQVGRAIAGSIVDAIVKEDVIEEAARLALMRPPSRISQRLVPRASRFKALGGALELALNQAVNSFKGTIAPYAIINCLRAACEGMSFRDGLRIESEEFGRLLFSVQSAALRHLFFAQRLASRVPGNNAAPSAITKVGIIGAGLMGGGIAICFVQKGIPVVLKDAKQEWLDAGMRQIAKVWSGQVQRGRLTEQKAKACLALVTPTLSYTDFSGCDLVIEAVPEIMALKKEIFQALDVHCKPDAVLCTNTSGLDIDELASVLKDPSRCMGTHFFSPAHIMQLLENVRASKSSERTIATGMAMGKLISKKALLVGNCDGFVGNRMLAPYASEARQLLEEGASIEQVDRVAESFGMAMGPMALGDLVGLDIFWKQRKAAGDMQKQTKTYMGPYELTDWLCEQGRFGQKTPDASINASGRGIFIHRGRVKHVDPEVLDKIKEIRKTKGVTARHVSDSEIEERLFFPLLNEGFRILDEGHATRSSDIDVVYIFGYGFPAAKGGPMFYAENYVGLPKLLHRLKVHAAQAKQRYTMNKHCLPVDYFEPSPLLIDCVQVDETGLTTKMLAGVPRVDAVLQVRRSGTAYSHL